MRVTLLLFCVAFVMLLIGCNGPSPEFRGKPVARVRLGGETFDIRRRGRLAEAIRINPRYAPRLGPLRALARAAMVSATGCGVTRLYGDAAVTIGRLECGKDAGAPVSGVHFECVPVSRLPSLVGGAPETELDCRPV